MDAVRYLELPNAPHMRRIMRVRTRGWEYRHEYLDNRGCCPLDREQSFDLQPSVHFPGLSDLVQGQRPGQGLPMFAAQHVTRHRMGIADHRCHVCGALTSKLDRFIIPVHVSALE